jgi:Ca2+-binding RTX toxin-like protein
MRRLNHCLWVVAVLAASIATTVAGAQQVTAHTASHLCRGHGGPGVACADGNGRRTRGGGNKVSHAGWPAVTGIVWIVRPATHGRTDAGTDFNDELLGSHGNDVISGGWGDDIIWGDQLPVGNNGWQRDVLDGGPGNDWIYSSHGYNRISGGPGNDHIWGHFGHGTIDCGPGYDVVHVKRHSTYRLRNCEKVLHH